MEKENPGRYEVDLRQEYEKKSIDNQFIFWQISCKLNAFIELK